MSKDGGEFGVEVGSNPRDNSLNLVGDIESHGVLGGSGGDAGRLSVVTFDHVVGVLSKDSVDASVDEETGEPSFNLDDNVGNNAEISLDVSN